MILKIDFFALKMALKKFPIWRNFFDHKSFKKLEKKKKRKDFRIFQKFRKWGFSLDFSAIPKLFTRHKKKHGKFFLRPDFLDWTWNFAEFAVVLKSATFDLKKIFAKIKFQRLFLWHSLASFFHKNHVFLKLEKMGLFGDMGNFFFSTSIFKGKKIQFLQVTLKMLIDKLDETNTMVATLALWNADFSWNMFWCCKRASALLQSTFSLLLLSSLCFIFAHPGNFFQKKQHIKKIIFPFWRNCRKFCCCGEVVGEKEKKTKQKNLALCDFLQERKIRQNSKKKDFCCVVGFAHLGKYYFLNRFFILILMFFLPKNTKKPKKISKEILECSFSKNEQNMF